MASDLPRRLPRALGYLAIVSVVLGYVVWKEQHQRGVVEELGAEDRQIVFDNTLESFRKLCVEHQGKGFGKYCMRQKDFLELFPECDQPCRDLVAKVEQAPTR